MSVVPVEGTVVHRDRYTLSDLRSSGGACGPLGGECGDLWDGVPGLSWAAAGALQLAAVDEQADAAEGDTELLRGLVGGEVAGPDVLRLHAPMMPRWAVFQGVC